jgi:predicted dinucleotide-binding enzyme
MTTAIIGTGGIGSVIARQLASGGETLRLASADHESARTLAAEIGRAAVAVRVKSNETQDSVVS